MSDRATIAWMGNPVSLTAILEETRKARSRHSRGFEHCSLWPDHGSSSAPARYRCAACTIAASRTFSRGASASPEIAVPTKSTSSAGDARGCELWPLDSSTPRDASSASVSFVASTGGTFAALVWSAPVSDVLGVSGGGGGDWLEATTASCPAVWLTS